MPEAPLLGAFVNGWSAFALDAILKRHLGAYLAQMTPAQRRELEATRAAVHAAALLFYEQSPFASASAQAAVAQVESPLNGEEITTAEAAELLQVSGQWVRQLAACWAEQGLARKVGRVWVLDRGAVMIQQDSSTRRRAA